MAERPPPRPEEIAVVVQGPVAGGPADAYEARHTLRALESVRRHLPGAEIILSTWAGSDVSGLPFDRLVESDDPGTFRCDSDSRPGFQAFYNANRQIVSSRNGLREAARPYAMKLRSDMVLSGTGFLRFFGRYPVRAAEWRVLEERVVTADWFSRSVRRRVAYPFHPSDWFHFGLRGDVLRLWDIPLADEEMVRWYDHHPRPEGDGDWWLTHRYTVEQHNWLAFLRGHGPVPFAHKTDAGPEARRLSELTIANNLVVAEVEALNIEFLKYPMQLAHWAALYTHGEWQRLYRDCCDPAFRPAPDARLAWKRGYDRWLAGAHMTLLSPRSSPVVRALSAGAEARFPGAFRAAKRAYVSGLAALGRRPGS
jgi:hypothetical protein